MSIRVSSSLVAVTCLLASAPTVRAQDTIAPGVVVDPVTCAGDPSQTYALYLPSAYSPDRGWTLLLAFHPAARGGQMVEKYKAAAERYGVIVAASNNARNGPHAISAAAAQAMGMDVSRRFSINPKRVYLTGFSGGARVALALALANPSIAGVIASGAGYADSTPRKRVGFAIFGTAGVEDFNYLEMREMDRALESPHFLAVFPGGHTLPPDEVAMEAIEWLEIEAMRSGLRDHDAVVAGAILEKRRVRIAAAASVPDTAYLLEALTRDFAGLADVSSEATRLEELRRQRNVRKILEREKASEEDEMRELADIVAIEARLAEPDARVLALSALRDWLERLSRQAGEEADTAERRRARRLLRYMVAGARARIKDADYLAMLERHSKVAR